MRDFTNENIFHCNEAIKEGKSMQQMVVYMVQEGKFYVLITFNVPEIVTSSDICIMISTEKKAKVKNFPAMKFRFWLNVKGVKDRVGNSTRVLNLPVDSIDWTCLMPKP